VARAEVRSSLLVVGVVVGKRKLGQPACRDGARQLHGAWWPWPWRRRASSSSRTTRIAGSRPTAFDMGVEHERRRRQRRGGMKKVRFADEPMGPSGSGSGNGGLTVPTPCVAEASLAAPAPSHSRPVCIVRDPWRQHPNYPREL
jgi:hypothetical protein